MNELIITDRDEPAGHIRTAPSGDRDERTAHRFGDRFLTFHRPGPAVSVNTNDAIAVSDEDGRVLLRIGRDGTVEGAIEDMGEAANIFVAQVRKLVQAHGTDLP